MRIAIINVTARTGSTGKIVQGLFNKLIADGHEVKIFYGKCDKDNSDNIIRITTGVDVTLHALLSRITGLHGYFSKIATKRLISMLDKWNPDIVQLYNLHGYYIDINMLLKYLSSSGISVVYSMVDEFPYLGRCCYSFDCEKFKTGCYNCQISKKEYPATWFFRFGRKFFLDKMKVYKKMEKICFVAPQYVIDRARSSALLSGRKYYVVDEYIDTENTFVPQYKYKYIDHRLMTTDKKIVLTIASYSDPRKGGKYFLDLANELKNDNNYTFVYIGMDKNGVNLPRNCIAKGYISNQEELAEYYSIADVFICTSLADSMPNVCLDALSCGTPVIGFDNTGIPYVANEPLGTFVKTGDVSLLKNALKKVRKKDKEIMESCRAYALSRYSPDVYYSKMVKIYESMMTKA